MTCWHLRNVLFPLLWNYVEGCRILPNHPAEDNRPFVSLESGLYPQCTYVILNPTIGVYVRCVCYWVHSNNTHGVLFLQGTFRGPALYGRSEGFDDKARRLPNSVAQPKDIGNL